MMRASTFCNVEALAARIGDGVMLAVPPDYSGCAMAVVRALVRRAVRGLHLLGVPQLGFQGDLLIGAAYLYFLIPRVILFTVEHTRRVLVPKVEFISAPGVSDAHIYRPGGPYALVTSRCVFQFDRDRQRFSLLSVHPGNRMDDIREHTGFAFDVPAEVPETRQPSTEALTLIRGDIGESIGETYPEFSRRVLTTGFD